MLCRFGGFLLLIANSVTAQVSIPAKTAQQVSRTLDNSAEAQSLGCRITPERRTPLDFAFRFESGYTIRCPIKLFGGNKGTLFDFVRVTPETGPAVVLGQVSIISAMPEELKHKIDIRKVNSEFEYSSVFAIGEGRYSVDVLVTDGAQRSVQKYWKIDAKRTGTDKYVQVAVPPGNIRPVFADSFSGDFGALNRGQNLTILLDAAPINPFSLKLQAWDRAFLLDSLSSLLTQIKFKSVRLVVFNLDQQREFFRDDNFDRTAWPKLVQCLRDIELGSISLRRLQQKQGESNLIGELFTREVASSEPSGAVVLLGPTVRITNRVPSSTLPSKTGRKPRLFYIDYCWYGLPRTELSDTLAHATRDLGGQVFKIHSPSELARAISEIERYSTEPHVGQTQ